ncbi:MAG: rod shape-determining protein [Myxococcota bacterium]|nr:rod shape-determining protein [Myxococcota bacterium]
MSRIQQTLCVDFGSANIRMFLSPRNEIFTEKACVATHVGSKGDPQFMALGETALNMIGRTPEHIQILNPIQNGDIIDFKSAEIIFKRLMHRVQGRMLWLGPNVIVCVQKQPHEIQQRAIRRLCMVSGARKVEFSIRALAIARAMELNIQDPHGHLIVDIGHETTDISILSLGKVVYEHRLKIAGKHIALSIVAALKDKYKMSISLEQAMGVLHEHLQLRINGSAKPFEVFGRCLDEQLPKTQVITIEELRQMVVQPIRFILEAIVQMLSVCTPRLASDIYQSGVILVGGGAQIKGLSYFLRKKLKLPVFVPDFPERLSVTGAIIKDT